MIPQSYNGTRLASSTKQQSPLALVQLRSPAVISASAVTGDEQRKRIHGHPRAVSKLCR